MEHFQTRFVETATGARLHLLDSGGDGETCIVLHGMLGTAALHLGPVMHWLRDTFGFRVIGPTLRGYGESAPKPRDFPLNFYQRDTLDVLALMDALEIDRAHILGYSDGGEIALLAAVTQPERFLTVSVWGAVGYFGPAMRPVVQRMYPGTWITDDEKAMHGISDPDAFALGWITSVRALIDSGGDLSLSQADQMQAPLLLMLGEQDTLNPREYGQRLVDRTPKGRLQMFACGHPVHEQASAAFYAAVGDFLRQNLTVS